jgi:septal ring factor EnvC (AmiA/AmiB activator)
MRRARVAGLSVAALVALAATQDLAGAPARAQDLGDLPADPGARLVAIERRIAEAVTEAESTSAEEARVRAELDGLAAGTTAANQRLRARARALYRMSRAGALPIAGGFEALLAHAARVERLERMVRRDAQALAQLADRAEALRAESQRLVERAREARDLAARLDAEKVRLEDEARRQAVYAAAFGRSVESSYDAATGYGIRVVDPAPAPAAGFEAERGRLALPVSSPRLVREATREDGRGIEIDATGVTAVHAVATGRVAFSDHHPVYGRLVILDHEAGWFTVYGGLARVDGRVGDRVGRGATIGAIDGGPLFFQVRRGTRAQDARAWLGL